MRIDLGPVRCIEPESSCLPAPVLSAPQRDNMRKLKFVMVTLLILVSLSSIGLSNAQTNLYFTHTGWNFVSIPIYPLGGEVSIRDIACDSSEPASTGECTEVYFYNSTDQTWYHWDKNKLDSENTLNHITSGYGYWFYTIKIGSTDTIEGTIIDPVNAENAWSFMQPGWNMMGWTGLSGIISDAVSQIKTKWSKEIKRVWHYDKDSPTLISDYWPDNASAVFKGQVGYWDCVYNPSDPTYCDTSMPPIMPWQTMPEEPVLSDGKRDPSGGNNETMFTFSITYTDANNDAPSSALVYIDGVPYGMINKDLDDNYTNGALYEYKTKLGNGMHRYYFEFADWFYTVRLPEEGEFYGPWVITLNFDLGSYYRAFPGRWGRSPPFPPAPLESIMKSPFRGVMR